jgi:hypothetical protein
VDRRERVIVLPATETTEAAKGPDRPDPVFHRSCGTRG